MAREISNAHDYFQRHYPTTVGFNWRDSVADCLWNTFLFLYFTTHSPSHHQRYARFPPYRNSYRVLEETISIGAQV